MSSSEGHKCVHKCPICGSVIKAGTRGSDWFAYCEGSGVRQGGRGCGPTTAFATTRVEAIDAAMDAGQRIRDSL